MLPRAVITRLRDSARSAGHTRPAGVTPARIVWTVAALMLAPALVMVRADPDLWGHVRFGLDILSTRTLPLVDPYSFTQDVPWINHEWLSELVMGLAYKVGGATGLALLKGVLVASFLAVVLGAYARAALPVTGAVLVLLAAGTGRQVMTLRPQLWTLLGVAVLCRLFIRRPREWWVIAVPVLFAIWVNVHGGWIVGAGLLAVWSTVQMFRPQASRALIVAIAALSAIATLLNPYGFAMWNFLAGTVRMSRAISEWQPLTTVPLLAWIPWLVVTVGMIAALAAGWRPPLERIAMIALLAFGAFRVERLSPLYVVATVILMSPILCAEWNQGETRLDPVSPTAASTLAIGLAIAVLGVAVAATNAASCISMSGPWVPDRVAGRALAATTDRGRIATYFDWGEYAIWHYGPRLRVSIDGRRETVYSDAVLDGHFAMNEATPEGLAYLRRLDPEYVWLPARFEALRNWLAGHGYRIDLRTDESFVAVRADQPALPAPAGALPPCFPGP